MGNIYYGKSGIRRLAHLEPYQASSSDDEVNNLSAYISVTGQVLLFEISKDNKTLRVNNIEEISMSQVSKNALSTPVAVQFLSPRNVVLFDFYGSVSLTEASVGKQLTHRVSGRIIIDDVNEITGAPSLQDGSVTVATGHVTQTFAKESIPLSPVLQNDLELVPINKSLHWLKLTDATQDCGWYNSDIGKTITMAGASSILITSYHNHTHATGIVVLPHLIVSVYRAGQWMLYNMRPYVELARVNQQVLHISGNSASLDTSGSFTFQDEEHPRCMLKTSNAVASIKRVLDESHVELDNLSGSMDGDYLPGEWSLYETAGEGIDAVSSAPISLWYITEPECSHILQPDISASRYPIRYLDVGDSFTFAVTAAATVRGAILSSSKKPLLFMTVTNPLLFSTNSSYTTDRFGSETLTVTLHHKVFNPGTSTIVIHMPDASLLCPITSFTLTIKCGCPPSKHLHFIYDPYIAAEEFLNGNPVNKKKKPLLTSLKRNYRPPSHLGIAIPLTDNVYNADPAVRSRPRDYYQISKESGLYKQCEGALTREECGCTDAMKLSSLERDTDCREKAYRQLHPGKVWPEFVIIEQDKEEKLLMDPYVLTLTEINNRTNYLVTDNPSASLNIMKAANLNLANGSELYSTRGLKVTLLGSELYHFRATVIEGFSYCPLQDEFQVYVDKPPLAYPTQMIIIASVSVGIGGTLFVIYLYYLEKHYMPPVRKVGSQCMDIH